MTKEQIIKAIPETLERLNLPEISHNSDIEFDGSNLTLNLEKYPASEYFGYDKEALDKQLKEDMNELRKAFKKLDGEEKESIYNIFSLDREDSEYAEESFINSMEETWNIIRFPWVTFQYIDGRLELVDASASDSAIYPPEIYDIYEPSSYFDELVGEFTYSFPKELEIVVKEQEGETRKLENSEKNNDDLIEFKGAVQNILEDIRNIGRDDILIITFLYNGNNYEYNVVGYPNAGKNFENLLNIWIKSKTIEQAMNDDFETEFNIPIDKISDINIRIE